MKQKLKKGRVKGTVLFTTTGVMLVLVVFLASTMVLATSANRRSYYTYYETQAQYAAQAALDAITASAYSDTEFHDWIVRDTDPVAHPGAQLPVSVDFRNTDIQFTNDVNSVVCIVERADSNFVWDDVTQAVHEQKAWKITATATVGNGKNASEYSVSNYIYENFHVEDPDALDTVQNVGDNTIYDYRDGGGGPVIPGPSSGGTLIPAILSLSASATNNNFVSLGPQYSGLAGLPVGRIKYTSARAGYTVGTANNNYAVGNILYANNLYSAVLRNSTFQRFGESAIYYGDLYNANAGDVAGFRWVANISNEEVAKYGGSIPYTSLPYVYVDGTMFCSDQNPPNTAGNTGGGGFYIGYGTNIIEGNYPVNLYCGAVRANHANDDFAVYGDAYLYDPELDSVICSGRMEGRTALTAFIGNNVQKANTQYRDAQNVGGNLYCNNRSLTLGEDKKMSIAGDLIFTNKQGTLRFTNDVTVGGKVICAGTIQGAEHLTCAEIITDPTVLANYYYDGSYGTYAVTGYNDRADATPLMPYPFRIDEIHKKYYRWDLASDSYAGAESNKNTDALIAESSAAGHEWGVQEISIVQDEPQYLLITDETDPRWSWASAYYDEGLGRNVCRVFNGSVYTTTTSFVPYTTPVMGQAFIPEYQWISPESALQSQTGMTAFNSMESVTEYDQLLGAGAENYTNSNKPTYVNSLPIVYHDAAGTQQAANVGAYVITKNCTINLNDGGDATAYKNSTIFIDPGYDNHNHNDPLIIKLRGEYISNCNCQIIVNNTASYDPNYTTYQSYADQGIVADRREVYIFFEQGLGAGGGHPFMLYTSGAYGQVAACDFRVVSNPVYPNQAGWSGLSASLKYAYELVPNVTIFGQKNAEYEFQNACIMNADVWMPNATIKNTNASLYHGTIEYREDATSIPFYAPDTPIIGIGSNLVREYNTGTNIAEFAYIGDEGRSSSTPPPTVVQENYRRDGSGNNLGNEYNDQFSNDHRGAN